MPVHNDFEDHERWSDGHLKFVLCPHCAEQGRPPDSHSRFINLIDTPGRVVTLVLCGVCANTVTGAFVGDIIDRIAKQQVEDIRQQVEKALNG